MDRSRVLGSIFRVRNTSKSWTFSTQRPTEWYRKDTLGVEVSFSFLRFRLEDKVYDEMARVTQTEEVVNGQIKAKRWDRRGRLRTQRKE